MSDTKLLSISKYRLHTMWRPCTSCGSNVSFPFCSIVLRNHPKNTKEIADSHTLVDKVSCSSAGLTEGGSPARWTRSHRIAPEVWIKMCESI
jgi:hypothetical protein